MKDNFILTILFFFVAMVVSGIAGEILKRKIRHSAVLLLGVVSIAVSVFLIMPVYRATAIRQIVLFTVLIFFLNFGFMILLPERGVQKNTKIDKIHKKR